MLNSQQILHCDKKKEKKARQHSTNSFISISQRIQFFCLDKPNYFFSRPKIHW